MEFNSVKEKYSYLIFVILFGVLGIIIYAVITSNESIGAIFPIALIIVIISFLAHCFVNTKYVIGNTNLNYKCGFIKGEIPIDKIKKIEYNNSIFVPVTLKLGWSHKGIIIQYNQYDDLYISPTNRDEFVSILKQLNPNITIIK